MWAQVVREKDKLEKHFPERYKVLCDFGFKWWWPVPEEGDKKIPPIRDNRSVSKPTSIYPLIGPRK